MKNIVTVLGATIIASFLFTSCGQNSNKQKELELKERELALKEKELLIKEKEISNIKTLSSDTIKNNIKETKTALSVKSNIPADTRQLQEAKSKSQPNISSSVNYKVILKNVVTEDNGSKFGDIYFNIKGIDHLVEKDVWIRNWQEFQNKGNKLIGGSIGVKGTMDGYGEYWLEKSGEYLIIMSSYIGGNAQIENTEVIKKIKL